MISDSLKRRLRTERLWALLFGIGVTLIVYAPLALILPGRKSATAKKKVALERISGLWSKRKETTLRIEEISSLWKSQGPTLRDETYESVSFEKPEIKRFHETYIDGKAYFNGAAGEVAHELLKLLDKEGDCPSVVNVEGDPEAKLEKTTFDILARTSLYLHTLHVAEEMIEANNSGPTMAKAVIAALAHDIGKLPRFRRSGYSLGDHPLFSVTALEMIAKFKSLTYAKDILLAVRDHHGRPRDPFSQALREADQQARRRELAEYAESHTEDKDYIVGAVAEGVAALEEKAPSNTQASKNDKDETKKPGETSISWFSPEKFLTTIKPRINRMEGGRWVAFSMPDGYVYVQAKVMWETAEILGKEASDSFIAMAAVDENMRRDILYTIVQQLRNYGVIAEDLIKAGYFGGSFIVRMRDGKELKGFYTPFKVEAFAESVSELEAIKEGRIRDIANVSPKYE